MSDRQLAFRYLIRKKGKVIILLLVLLFINSMILSTSIILRAAENSKRFIQEKTQSKVVLEITRSDEMMKDFEVNKIQDLDDVLFINRMSGGTARPTGFSPVTGNENEDNPLEVSLLSYDDLENDSAFTEQRYRLLEGKYINQDTPAGVVINSQLAEFNGLKLGDQINLHTNHGEASAEIIGLFLAGGERKQSREIDTVDRLENQIFIDNTTFSELYPDHGFHRLSVYTKSPDQLEQLEKKLQSLFHERVEMVVADTLYQQMRIPLDQLMRVTGLMLVLTFITGTIVVSLLLCMWMGTRQKEIAIFISLGRAKRSIMSQIFLESFAVFLFSVAGAGLLGNAAAKFLGSLLINFKTSEITLDLFIQWNNIGSLLMIGGLIIIISVTCSLIPVLIAKPKDTLSKMEG